MHIRGLLLCLASLGAAPVVLPRIPLGKDTTRVLGPLDAWGHVDYAAAINERRTKEIKPADNASVLLWRAIGPRPEGALASDKHFTILGMERPPEKGEYFVDLGQYAAQRLKLKGEKAQPFYEEQSRASRRVWKAKELPRIDAWLKANEKPLTVAVEASKRPRYFTSVVSNDSDGKRGMLIAALLPSVQKVRGLVAALSARAMLRAGEGDADGSWADLRACHRLGRLVAQGNWLIEALVGYAVENIATDATVAYLDAVKPDTKRLAAMRADLEALPVPVRIADLIDSGERLMFLDCTQMLDRDGLKKMAAILREGTAADSLLAWAGRIDCVVAMRAGNAWFDRMADALRLASRAERLKAFAALEAEMKAMRAQTQHWTSYLQMTLGGEKGRGKVIGNVLLTLLTPALARVQEASDRMEQTRANLRLALLLEKHHREKGAYPESLAGLGKAADDLFSGKALVYKLEGNGYLLYSVGPNGKDEGGRTRAVGGDDLAVRLPPKKEK